MPLSHKIIINDIQIDVIDYTALLSEIENSILSGKQLTVGYVNANTFNLTFKIKALTRILNKFDIVHPDGIGIYLASRYLVRDNGLKNRFTGSDFYPLLWEKCIEKDFSIFFFGHNEGTLSKIQENIPKLKTAGYHAGYEFNDETVIEQINSSNCDILVAGLGTPLQETWVMNNKDKIRCKVVICVGEGIKVFAGDKKRGPVIFQKFGMEWIWRWLTNPLKYFTRYIIGNPLFLYRIFRIKMRKLA